LHQYLACPASRFWSNLQPLSDGILKIKHEAILATSGCEVELPSNQLHQSLGPPQFAGLAFGYEARFCEIRPPMAVTKRSCHPAQNLKITKPSGTLLAVRL
jgi:hypothetical protein